MPRCCASAEQRAAGWSAMGQSHPIRPAAMLGQGTGKGGAGVVWVSLEVLC